jgi:hypothetical protein
MTIGILRVVYHIIRILSTSLNDINIPCNWSQSDILCLTDFKLYSLCNPYRLTPVYIQSFFQKSAWKEIGSSLWHASDIWKYFILCYQCVVFVLCLTLENIFSMRHYVIPFHWSRAKIQYIITGNRAYSSELRKYKLYLFINIGHVYVGEYLWINII